MPNLKFQMLNNPIIRYWKLNIGSIGNLRHWHVGFSLIELMVVFSLMGLVASIGFASFSSYSQRQTVIQTGYDIKQVFDNAKFNALSSVKTSTSCTNPNTNLVGYKVVICSKANCIGSTGPSYYELDTMCSDTDSLLYSKKLPQGVTVSASSTCSEVKYNTLSNSVTGTPCVLTISGYGTTQNINIDSGGNASTQ